MDSEALQACFHVCVITMKLFFSIREFRSQQISSSTENIYLVKTSVIFAIRGHREGLRPTFRLYTSEAMGAQNDYYLKANDSDAMNDFSGTVSEVCTDLW